MAWRRRSWTVLFLFALLGPGVGAPPALAHAEYRPFSLSRYAVIAFEPGQVRIAYAITVGDLPAQRLRQRYDADGDGVLDRAEGEAMVAWFGEGLYVGLALELDGAALNLRPQRAAIDLVTDQVEMMAPLWLRFEYRIPCPAGVHKLVYHDRAAFPELGQTELFVRRDPAVRLIRVARPQKDRGVVERMFWEEGSRPGPVWLRFEMAGPAGLAGAPGPGADPLGADDRLAAPAEGDGALLKRALADADLGLAGLLLALGMAFLLGAFHALSPGHGKTLVAAYLVGAQGTVRHAILLGLIVTLTHVFSVFLLGLLALWASESFLPDRIAPWTSLAAGLLVLSMGLWMGLRRLRAGGLSHHHDHDQHHGHDHHHDHNHGQQHEGGDQQRAQVRMGELLVLGISGGMVPCPSAVVVLLFAIYVGRIALGLGLIGAFSLGLAATLVIIGVAVVRARKLLARFSASGRLRRWAGRLPLLSAAIICVIGTIMVTTALLAL